MDRDPRYDAVGSSSLREELFNTFVKTLASTSTSTPGPSSSKREETEADKKRSDKERKERAVREREEQVRRERERVERDLGRSKNALSREENEAQFMCAPAFLLVFTVVGRAALIISNFLGLCSRMRFGILWYATPLVVDRY